MAIVDELVAVLGYEIEGEANLKRYQASIDGLSSKLGKLAGTIGKTVAAGAGVMAAGFGFLGKSVISTSAQFETFQTTLETIEGSSEKARQSMDWIEKFGRTTPYELDQVTEAFVSLKAYGIDPLTDDALRTLGDTASAMGKPLQQAVEAFADAATGEFERLKEFGIKASAEGDNVTFAWTKDGQELRKTVQKNSTEIRAFLLETWGDRFNGAMIRQSKTWSGMMSNLADTWSYFIRKIGEGGLFENVKARLASLLDTLNRLDEDGTLVKWANTLSDIFVVVADTVGFIANRIVRNVTFLAEHFDTLKPFIVAIGIALGVLVAAAFPVVTAIAAIGLAIDDLISFLSGGDSVIGRVIDSIKNTNWYELGVNAITSLWNGMKSIGNSIYEWFKSLVPNWAQRFMQGSVSQSVGMADRIDRDINRNTTVGGTNVTINQTVTQPTNAPNEVARATGNAVSRKIPTNRGALELDAGMF